MKAMGPNTGTMLAKMEAIRGHLSELGVTYQPKIERILGSIRWSLK